MHFKVRSWRQVFVFSGLITAFATAVPLVVVSVALWPVPLQFKLPILAISGFIPLFIAFPVSVFALYVLKLVNNTVEALDNYVKFDHLTGVLTRGYFLSSVELQRGKGGHFLLLDADHFKRVNDTYGHDHGDEVLKHIARTILHVTGGSGIVGRLGGEEFGIYLPKATPEQAKLLAAGLGAALRNSSVSLNGRDVITTVSIGIAAEFPAEPLTATMKRADICLYAAKQQGRDCFVRDGEDQTGLSAEVA